MILPIGDTLKPLNMVFYCLFIQMQGLTVADGLDDVDFAQIAARAKQHRNQDSSFTDLEVHVSESDAQLNEKDMRFVDRIVGDSTHSPSNYHSNKRMASNIPNNAGGNGRTATPRSGDLLETKSHKYTEQKPFTPRTLKTKHSSKLSQFKYYTPAKKKPVQSESGPTKVLVSRSETPATDTSMDIMMNETLMSRDFNRTRPKNGVPPLDISLDADHVKWLKEQTRRGHLRSTRSVMTRSEAESDLGSLRLPADMRKDLMEADPNYDYGRYTYGLNR